MFPREQWELRRSYSRAAIALLAYTILSQSVAALVMGLGGALGWEWINEGIGLELLNTVIVYPSGILMFTLCLRRLPVPKLTKAPPPEPMQVVDVLAAAVGMLYVGSYLTQWLLRNTDTADFANDYIGTQSLPVALVFTVVLAPVFEELLFRKLLLDRLLFLGDWSAILISALFFGLFHVNLYQFLYAVLVGTVLAYIRIMTGRMGWNIALHMFINLFCGTLIRYVPEDGWQRTALLVVIWACILYLPLWLIRYKPWQNFYPGPMSWYTPGDKLRACFTSVPFWVCVAVHLGLGYAMIHLGSVT